MILDKVKEIISDQLNISKTELSADTSFIDDLNADSLDVYQVIMAVEEEFSVEVSNKDIEKITTIGDVVLLIKKVKNLL